MALQVTLIAYDKDVIKQRDLIGKRHVIFWGGDITPVADRKEMCNFDRGWVIAEILNRIICKADGLKQITDLGEDCSTSGYAVTFEELLRAIGELYYKLADEKDEVNNRRLNAHVSDLVSFVQRVNWKEQVVYATS